MSTFHLNFKRMLEYICKAASSTVDDCPFNSLLLSQIISWIFENDERKEKVLTSFRENRKKVDQMYHSDTSLSFSDALKQKDRSLFRYINIFPSELAEKYNSQILWFSNFLEYRMQEKHINTVFSFLESCNRHAGPI